MAKVVTSFDTQTKEFTVTLDDKKVKNVSSVEFYGLDNNKAYCELTTVEIAEDKDMVKVTRISAEENEIEISEAEQNDVANELLALAKFYR